MASPKFQHTTRAAFKDQFFKGIGDSSKSFWTDAEANLLLNEALYTFGAIGHIWRNQIEIKTDVSKVFYDIATDLFADQQLTAFNLTYQFILDAINFHLIEDISVGNPTSEITSLSEILEFAEGRVNEYQFKTGLVLTKNNYVLNPANDNVVIVNDEVIDVVRVAFVKLDELSNPDELFPLKKEDEISIGYFNRNSFNSTTDRPTYYTSVFGNLNTIKVYPSPSNLCELEVISVNGIPSSSNITLASKVGIPDNLVPYIKWGVLADIYAKDGIAYNPTMAAYCEQRWNEGIIIGNNYTSVLEAKLNGLPLMIDSIESVDNSQFGWQNNINAPSLLVSAGYNLFATNCRPDNIYSILMFSVTNAYIPVDDNDFIDIKLEYVDPLIRYCIHLANVKNGYEAVQMTSDELGDFVQTGIKNNIRLMNRGKEIMSTLKVTKRQEEEENTRVKEEAA